MSAPSSPPPDVPRAPAPWALAGDAYVFLLRLPEQVIREQSFIPEALAGRAEGRTGVLMFVDYTSSDVGPYRELLYIPCRFRVDGRLYWSITRIYVSTWDSVVNGQENWGIPKDRADFTLTREGGLDHVEVRKGDHVIASLSLKARSFGVPASSLVMPEAMRTLVQIHGGRRYFYAPSATSKARFGKIVEARFDPAFFPDITQGSVIFGAKLEAFKMSFPAARIEPAA